MTRTLVAGWFSFEQMGATAGDLLARDLACRWLEEAGRECVVATAPPFEGGVDWRELDPASVEDVVFVCGPAGNGKPLDAFVERFRGRRLVGLDLTMLAPLEDWDPFDLLWERDSDRASRPDIVFLADPSPVPVVGVVLVHPQKEYRRGMHAEAHAAIDRLLASREVAAVPIDTRLDVNGTGLRTAREVASLVARMDVVVTTRLHGLVLALSAGIPAVVVDPVAGGAKVARQGETLGWPAVLRADHLDDEALGSAFDYCLTEDARREAARCRHDARRRVAEVRDEFISVLR